MKDKKIISFILVMVFAITMSGCNSNKGVEEKQLINDIQQSEYLQKSNMIIEDVQIEKRKTDIQNKSDTMIAWVNAKRDTMESKMCFSLTYKLYNDGWLIETITHYQDENWEFIPLKGISQESADTRIKEYSKNISSSKCIEHEEDLENSTSYFTYELEEEYPYATKSKTVKINYEFNVTYDAGLYTETWKDTVDTVDSKEDWNIDGTWEYNYLADHYGAGKINCIINIDNFNGYKVNGSYNIDINFTNDDINIKNNGVYETKEVFIKREYNTTLGAWIDVKHNGFVIENEDGTAILTNNYLFPKQPAFCFDENEGIMFVNPYNGELCSMTKK